MKMLRRVIGPVATNLYVLVDEPSGEAVAIDTATPCVEWLTTTLAERGYQLKLIVSTHRHWDHIGDNAALSEATGRADRRARPGSARSGTPDRAQRAVPDPAVRSGDRPCRRITHQFGEIDLEVLHTPGHTEGSVCLLANGERLLFTGDTLFAGLMG